MGCITVSFFKANQLPDKGICNKELSLGWASLIFLVWYTKGSFIVSRNFVGGIHVEVFESLVVEGETRSIQ